MDHRELSLAGMDVADFLNRVMKNEALARRLIQKFTEDTTIKRCLPL